MITKFLRSDGIEFEAEVGSESFLNMLKDGRFKRVYTEEEASDQASADRSTEEAKPLADLSKKELLAEAESRGLAVDAKANKAQLVAAIEEHDAKQ